MNAARIALGGADVHLAAPEAVLAEARERWQRQGDEPLVIVPVGLDHLHHYGLDSGREGWFAAADDHADWLLLPDSRVLVIAAHRVVGRRWAPIESRRLLEALMQAAGRSRARIGLVGADQERLAALACTIGDRFGAATVVGVWSPQAGTEVAAGLDLLVVDMASPQREEWVRSQLAAARPAVVFAAPGAVDWLAGAGRLRPRRPLRSLGRALGVMSRLLAHSKQLSTPEGGDPAPVMATPATWQARLARVLLLLDAVVIGLASLLAYVGRELAPRVAEVDPFVRGRALALAVLPVWLAILYASGCYKPAHFNAGWEALRRFLLGVAAGVLTLGFVSYLFELQVSRAYVAVFSLLVTGLGLGVRLGLRSYLARRRRRGRYCQNVVVVGADEEAIAVAEAMVRADAAGYRVAGFLADDLEPGSEILPGVQVLGAIDDVLDHAYDQRAGLVVVSPTAVRPGTLRQITVALEGSPVDIAIAPSLFQVVTRRVTVESVSNVPILHVDQVRIEGVRRLLKRTVDIVGAAVLLALLAPVMAAAALAIRLEGPGPVIFRQTRVGRDGRPFILLKFRTMHNDADEHVDAIAGLNEAGQHFFKVRHDPRVTAVGRRLRRWSIDETPQLWNVLRGRMALVGPRPPLPREVEKYEPWHLRRLRVRPGITGLWQVSGRSNVPFDEAVRLDLFYIENWSLGLDLLILARTVAAVLGRGGAW